MKSHAKIAKLFKDQRDEAQRGLGVQYNNTIRCQTFYNDDQSNYETLVQTEDVTGRKRPRIVNFQKIPQHIDSVVGFMAQNRRQAKYTARVNGRQPQQLYSRNMNALYTFHRDNMHADQLESRQDLQLVVNGYGAIETDLSYIIGNATLMPGGEILKVNLDPMRTYWAPDARAPNVADARFAGYYNDYKLQDALDLFQGSKKDDFEAVSATEPEDKAGYVYNPWGGLYDKIKLDNTVEWTAKEEDMVRVYNHQWFEYETFYRATNPIYVAPDAMTATHGKMKLDMIKEQITDNGPENIDAGDMFDFDPLAEELTFDEATKRRLVAEFGDLIQPVGFKRKVFYTAVISGKHVFTAFKSICQQGFSIQFKTGQYNERGKFWIGMVNAMIEPQLYYNKALTELMFTIAANSKGGVYVEEDAVEDMADFESKEAKTNAAIVVRSGALAAGKIQPKARPALPTGLNDILVLSESALASNGVDPAFLGEANAQETGILYKRRIRQIISKMWWVADAITQYQTLDARICADLIRVWVQNNQGVMMRIIGEDGADEFISISEDMLAPEYDVTIQEGAQTPEEKQEVAQLLFTMADKYLSVGDVAKASILNAEAVQMLTLDGDQKNRITTALTGDGQSVPMAQYQMLQQQLEQLKSAMTQAQVAKLQSEAAKNNASVRESAAKVIDITETAKQKNTETQIIRQHSATANVTV